jgi:RNA polymerase sigma factor (sigma-70 family)
VHLPDGTVHLHIALERHREKEHYIARLTLRVPSNILHCEKSADNVIKAFDDAMEALLRELEMLQSKLRGEQFWKRKERRKLLHELKASGFDALPLAKGSGPQNRRDVVRDLFQQHYKDLLRHARRHILQDELAGEIPRGALDPKDIVDEVVRKAMAKVDEGPKGMSWVSWFYHLVHEELKRQHWLLKHKGTEEIAADETKTLPEDAERAAGYDIEQPLDIIEEKLEPPLVRTESLIPDSTAMPPDEFVAQKDALARLEQDMRNWPRSEREVFELYYVEGLEPEEIAMVTGQTLAEVRRHITFVQARLRQEILGREGAI